MNNEKWGKIAKTFGIYSGVFIGLWLLFIAAKLWFLYDTYSFLTNLTTKVTGLDQVYVRPIAVLFTVGTILALPCISAFLLYGGKKTQVAVIALLATSLYTAGIYFSTDNVFFDRTSGKAVKYYIKTLNGYKFSSTDDFDPVFGVKYKVITKEMTKEYQLWQKTGKLNTPPKVKEGQYFDTVTGEPITWFSKRTDGAIYVFSLPGYDPLTGEALKPTTKEIAAEIINRKAGMDEVILKFIQNNNYYFSPASFMEWYYNANNSIEDNYEEFFDTKVEKIIQIHPFYTLIGVCFREPDEKTINIHLSLFDNRGLIHNYKQIIINGIMSSGNTITTIQRSETLRVVYVFPYINLEYLSKGTINVNNGTVSF